MFKPHCKTRTLEELHSIAEWETEVQKGRRKAILKLQNPAILIQKFGGNRRERSEESQKFLFQSHCGLIERVNDCKNSEHVMLSSSVFATGTMQKVRRSGFETHAWQSENEVPPLCRLGQENCIPLFYYYYYYYFCLER